MPVTAVKQPRSNAGEGARDLDIGIESVCVSALGALIEALPFGIVLLGEGRKVLARNAEARRLLASPYGGSGSPQIAALIEPLVAGLSRDLKPRKSLRFYRGDEGQSVFMYAMPFQPVPGIGPWTALLISETARDLAPLAPILEEHFALTPSEARLALQLARGEGVQSAAEVLGLSVHTARSYLKTIFSKLGVSRQADVVRLITSLIVPTGAEGEAPT